MTLARIGWTCPVCKRGVSPDRDYCEHPARSSTTEKPNEVRTENAGPGPLPMGGPWFLRGNQWVDCDGKPEPSSYQKFTVGDID